MLKKISEVVSKVSDVLEKIDKYFSISILVVLICIVFFQVVSRVLTGKSFVQIEEISIVMAAWVGFFTLAYTTKRGVHVRIDVFSNKLPLRTQYLLNTIICFTTLIATIYLVKYGWALAMRKMEVPLMVLPFPSGVQYLSFPLGMAFTSVFLLDQCLKNLNAFCSKQEK